MGYTSWCSQTGAVATCCPVGMDDVEIMSLAGLVTFERNLRILMDSEAFRNATPAEQLDLGCRLLNSPYGLPRFGCVRVQELQPQAVEKIKGWWWSWWWEALAVIGLPILLALLIYFAVTA